METKRRVEKGLDYVFKRSLVPYIIGGDPYDCLITHLIFTLTMNMIGIHMSFKDYEKSG